MKVSGWLFRAARELLGRAMGGRDGLWKMGPGNQHEYICWLGVLVAGYTNGHLGVEIEVSATYMLYQK
jgi:hypothetical protein